MEVNTLKSEVWGGGGRARIFLICRKITRIFDILDEKRFDF